MAGDIPFDKKLDLKPGQVDEVAPGRAPRPRQQSGAVHLQGHAELHRRPRQGRDHRSRPGRRGPYRRAARRGARRDRDPYFRHPHPSRPFAGGAGASRRRPARPSMPKARIAPRGRCISASTSGSMPAATAISAPTSRLRDGEVVRGDGWTLEAVTTPGHTANHMAYRASRKRTSLFSGDHVMAWSTSIVAPPDGAMSDYMASLDKLARRSEHDLFPRPRPAIARCAALRRVLHPASPGARGSILHRLAKGDGRHSDAGARDLYRPRSAARPARPGSRCWRIWKIWSRAAWSRPTARRRSRRLPLGRPDACGAGAWRLLRLLRLLGLSGAAAASSMSSSSAAHPRGIGAEVVAAVARGRAHVDARAVAERRDADHHVVAEAHDRRARDRLDDGRRGVPACGARASTTRHLRLVTTASAAS